jgi:hypothetical protein
MGFADRLRAWLRGEQGPDAATRSVAAGRSDVRSAGRPRRRREPTVSLEGLDELAAFAASRRGVEVYLEPRTNLYGHSVLLVADDGEYLRRPVADPRTARAFSETNGLPLYDAARVGYPRRVRDYDRGLRPKRIEISDLPPWPDASDATDARDAAGTADAADERGGGDELGPEPEPPPPPI